MSYKIAVASSDNENINKTFGSAEKFLIYEVTNGVYQMVEERICTTEEAVSKIGCNSYGCKSEGGFGSGCGGKGELPLNVELIADCRAVVCKKIGFHIQKQLEHKAISAFDVCCTIDEALDKITSYYSRIDNQE
ncbi:MAG: hypothetical protein K2O29_00250 [Ruminococcus sp.]|nr:hypothetical protein [Ruminococcus sp.]